MPTAVKKLELADPSGPGTSRLDVALPARWGSGVRVHPLRAWRPGPTVFLADTGGVAGTPEDWYDGALEQFARAAVAAIKDGPTHGRDRPLLGVPLVGSGLGGLAPGKAVSRQLETLARIAHELAVDIALVTATDAAYAACQFVRARQTIPTHADLEELEQEAIRLASLARSSKLVLFVGAGVSVGAGLPLWSGLLQELAGADPELAGSREFAALQLTDQARVLSLRIGAGKLGRRVANIVGKTKQHSLAHALLAGLPVDQVVTTNYDQLFERASNGAGKPLTVIPTSPDVEGRWLLKLHGSVTDHRRIVLTRQDYLRYTHERQALAGLVQAMLITRHMLFVGFSLDDDNFHRIADDVRRAIGTDVLAGATRFGTALMLDASPLKQQLWREDVAMLSMAAPVRSLNQAGLARRLEVFLDCLGMHAIRQQSFLLDPGYAQVLTEKDRALRELLEPIAKASGSAREAPGWEEVGEMLARLGAADGGRVK